MLLAQLMPAAGWAACTAYALSLVGSRAGILPGRQLRTHRGTSGRLVAKGRMVERWLATDQACGTTVSRG